MRSIVLPLLFFLLIHTQGRGPGGAGRVGQRWPLVEEPKAKEALLKIFICTLEWPKVDFSLRAEQALSFRPQAGSQE